MKDTTRGYAAVLAVVRSAWALVDNTAYHDWLPLTVSRDDGRRGMSPEQALALADTVMEFERRLPGWWWSVASCSVTRDASCGPDRNGPDADLLRHHEMDAGIHHDGEGDVVESLRIVMEHAIARRTELRQAIEARRAKTRSGFVLAREPGPEGETPKPPLSTV